MLLDSSLALSAPDLNWAIERQIVQRTHGRIRQLDVDASSERVVVRGFASCYYLKQLAVAAVSEIVETIGCQPAVQMEIQVTP